MCEEGKLKVLNKSVRLPSEPRYQDFFMSARWWLRSHQQYLNATFCNIKNCNATLTVTATFKTLVKLIHRIEIYFYPADRKWTQWNSNFWIMVEIIRNHTGAPPRYLLGQIISIFILFSYLQGVLWVQAGTMKETNYESLGHRSNHLRRVKVGPINVIQRLTLHVNIYLRII